ncbi:type II glyceraldehyde-3-phosphate dehydrogenase [Candidatus Woesearchaeota archaeon]|nr:type II glyceraldehyde-3-phosphate dehydrogenase [Candidatus Woesearchaeota archaeon]
MINVGVVGYGTIGKRVADAVILQEDMKLVGVTGRTYNYRLEIAASRGIDIYSIETPSQLKDQGIKVKGNLKDLLKKADIIVDCSPKPCGKENIDKYYKPAGVKAILQGGEKNDAAELSFVAQCNYRDAINKDYVRVVSCNTTGMCRTLHALDKAFGVKKARATLIRRGGDPHAVTRGPINAIVPSFELPSHHGPDVRTVLYDMEVFTTAVIVPTTMMHMHNMSVVLKKQPSVKEVVELFKKTPRVRVIKANHKLGSTAEVIELARDLGYKRGDMMDICVWEEGIGLYDGELFFPQAVHQESDVIPENIDAIRAMMGFKDQEKSIMLTNISLGI